MKKAFVRSALACSLLGLGHEAFSQLLPSITATVERTVEQVSSTAVERSVEQVQTQVVERTVEQVQTQAVERTVEQVQVQAVERTVEQVQTQVVERTVEQVQTQVVDRTVDQVQTEVIDRTVQQVQTQVVDRTVQQVQNTAIDRVVQQQADTVANQVVNRVEAVAEAVQNTAAAQVQQVVEAVQNTAAAQVQTAVESVQAQTLEQVRTNVEQVQAQAAQAASGVVERAQAQAAAAVADAVAPTRDAGPAPDSAGNAERAEDPATRSVTGAVPDDAVAAPSQRQTIQRADGSVAFVEITLEPGVRAIEFEWLMAVTPEQRARLDVEAPELLTYLTGTAPFTLADGLLLTFTVPPDLDANGAILDLVPANMRDLIDRNHIFDESQHTSGMKHDAPLLSLPMPSVCTAPVAVGVIDSVIDAEHPALAQRAARIHSRSFVEEGLTAAAGHGTAVASLLVGDAAGPAGTLHPLLPEATLYTAAVFHEQEGAGQSATAVRILTALDWLVQQEDVRVINMSLAGPPNRLLEQALAASRAKGKVVVAAAGNEGPYGPLRYPAAYDSAVGVTAVDRAATIFRFANRGDHIDYAALGVEVPTALDDGSIGPASGTSLAAPIVAAFVACALAEAESPDAALAALDLRVRDLGEAGTDPVYGRGMLHPESPAVLNAQR